MRRNSDDSADTESGDDYDFTSSSEEDDHHQKAQQSMYGFNIETKPKKQEKHNRPPQSNQGYFESLFERSRTTDYETFLYGFFYFFIL